MNSQTDARGHGISAGSTDNVQGMDAGGGVLARYGLFDLGSGTVDNVTVAQTVKYGVASFLYFYDVPEQEKRDRHVRRGWRRSRNALLQSWR